MGNTPPAPVTAFLGCDMWLFMAISRGCKEEYEVFLGARPRRTSIRLVSSEDLLEWALACGLPPAMVCPTAAAAGRVGVLRRAMILNCPCDEAAVVEKAAVAGHLGVIRWARRHLAYRAYHLIFLIAHAYQHAHIVAYFKRKGFTLDLPCGNEYVCASMARGGHLRVLQWLLGTMAHKFPVDSTTCAYAAEGGHLQVLQWLRENGCEWDQWTCAYAARGGHLQVLRWARAQGCDWSVWACRYAAGRGHLHVLRWLTDHGCEWDGREEM